MKKEFNTYLLSTKPKFKWNRSAIPTWINIAMSELGQTEIIGDVDNPAIVDYHEVVDIRADKGVDDIPWCSAFVNWVILKSGYEPTRKGLARSWLKWGVKLDEPKFGAIVILKRGRKPWMGHVGFILDVLANGDLVILGGNQNNRVGINTYKSNKTLGFVWPDMA